MKMILKKYIINFITFMIIMILTISPYAAIVSDSDGAAFVNKKEFEDLKESFAFQLDNYNNSIDEKISGALASYISGLQVLERERRSKLIPSAESWLMYNEKDYPKYVEGYPYITGYTFYGNLRKSTPYGSTWAGVTFNGDPNLRTNGGFKKHIVGKPSKNEIKNGNSNYVAEWKGYYKDEGELITLAGFKSEGDGSWAAVDEDTIQWRDIISFTNAVCPVQIAHFWITNIARGTCTSVYAYASGAQRLPGKIVGDTNVSIYKNISDNRFWDSTMSNRVGITATTPAITYRLKSTNMQSWLTTVIPSSNVKLTCSTKVYNATTKRYTLYYDASWEGRVPDAKGYENFQREYTITDYQLKNNTSEYYLFKLANDPNNLQFTRLWSGVTNTVAQNLKIKMEDTDTSATDKATIKAALLYDSDNTPHLSMGAGYPFLEVAYDEEVEFDFKIKESGNYRVYAKYGPFSPTGNAATEADVIFDITSGGTTTHSTALPVTGGNNTKMKFKVKKDGTNYIFLKWCDTSATKGGTLDLTNDPIVTPAL